MMQTTYTVRLMQNSGVQGPQTTIQADSPAHASELAAAWAMGESGHPWDTLTVTDEESGDCWPVEQGTGLMA